jgi:hypothetical protein
VATNKLVAKIATDVGKGMARSGALPHAICVVPPGEEAAFLAPLPADALWGVGPKTAEKLAGMGILTIGDLAAWPADDLTRRFGQHGEDLTRHARGIDQRPIITERATKSISQETTFAHNVVDRASLEQGKAESKKLKAEKSSEDAVSSEAFIFQLSALSFPLLARLHHANPSADPAPAHRRGRAHCRGGPAAVRPDLEPGPAGAADRRGRERAGHAAAPAQPVGCANAGGAGPPGEAADRAGCASCPLWRGGGAAGQ